MHICKDGRIWGQTNKQARGHLGVLTGRKKRDYKYIKKGYNPKSSWPKGKKHSDKSRIKMSEKHKGKGWIKGNRHSEKTKIKMRESHIKFLTSGKAKFKDTSIELKIENELKCQGIPYMKQAPLENIAVVDFLLPNKVIIQADGNYFHSRKINKGRDIAQDTILGFKGYKVYRFSETQINKSPKKCINKIFKIRG